MLSFDRQYYETIMKTNGYNPFEFWYFDFNLWDISAEELQLRFLCHHGLDKFVNSYKDWTKSIITTGFWMSGSPHLWTISQLMRTLKINEAGIDTQIVLGDLDAYCGKKIELQKVLDYSERYKNFIGKLWYTNKVWRIIRGQAEHPEILHTSYLAGAFMDDRMFDMAEEDLHDFYVAKNKVDKTMSYRRRTSLSLMIADFLDLWAGHDYCLWNTYSNVWVMLGIDEHQYVKFWEKVLENIQKKKNIYTSLGKINLSAIYTPLIKWFNNYPKQSKSFPESSINADSNKDEIYKKILKEEWEYDFPENSVVYQMMAWTWNYNLDEYKKIYQACKMKGSKRISLKKEFASYLIELLSKREK